VAPLSAIRVFLQLSLREIQSRRREHLSLLPCVSTLRPHDVWSSGRVVRRLEPSVYAICAARDGSGCGEGHGLPSALPGLSDARVPTGGIEGGGIGVNGRRSSIAPLDGAG